MKKRGQLSIVLIVVVMLAIILGFSYYIYNSGSAKKSAIVSKSSSQAKDSDLVRVYAENCLKAASEDALFNRLGLLGGYIDSKENAEYGERGIPESQAVQYAEFKLPYAPYATPLQTADIEKKMENYVIVEFEKCFNKNKFRDIGIAVKKPEVNYQMEGFDLSRTDVGIKVQLNDEDVSVQLKYPLNVKINDAESKIENFNAAVPIRFKELYESSKQFVDNAMAAQPEAYALSSRCNEYNKNGLTNVYVLDNGARGRVIRFVDFSTYQNNYFKSFVFQFAMKDAKIEGECSG